MDYATEEEARNISRSSRLAPTKFVPQSEKTSLQRPRRETKRRKAARNASVSDCFQVNCLGTEADEDGNEAFARPMASSFAGPDEDRAGVVDSGAQKRACRGYSFSREIAH